MKITEQLKSHYETLKHAADFFRLLQKKDITASRELKDLIDSAERMQNRVDASIEEKQPDVITKQLRENVTYYELQIQHFMEIFDSVKEERQKLYEQVQDMTRNSSEQYAIQLFLDELNKCSESRSLAMGEYMKILVDIEQC